MVLKKRGLFPGEVSRVKFVVLDAPSVNTEQKHTLQRMFSLVILCNESHLLAHGQQFGRMHGNPRDETNHARSLNISASMKRLQTETRSGHPERIPLTVLSRRSKPRMKGLKKLFRPGLFKSERLHREDIKRPP